MKEMLCALFVLLLLLSLSACGSTVQPPQTPDSAQTADVDLTALSGTMVYSEVFNMLTNPDAYRGKTVKMRGLFAVYHDETADRYYFACLINDATACCQQGIEFVLSGDFRYPEDYPALGTEITVSGEFSTYQEGQKQYCTLIHASILPECA